MRSFVTYVVWGALFVFVACIVTLIVNSRPPKDFPVGTAVSIEKGMTLSETADSLEKAGIIRSETVFKIYATLINKTGVRTGEYLFSGAESALNVAKRLIQGLEGFPVVKVTIPEGSDSEDIAAIVSRQIPQFASSTFVALARPDEGYLFPETYLWAKNIKPEEVAAAMKAEFATKIATIRADLASSSRSEADVIKMAAILEREASSSVDRRIISGILWKRLDAGMALQVDAPFEYALHKSPADLTLEDLAKDTPYNLYLYKGLTPKPIANPGLSAILDALHPTTTKFWYYLSDSHGVLHYASTLEGHAANKNKYIR